jgi:hypothetical protein
MTNNLTKINLEPFLNKVVTSGFNFKDFIAKELPIIPGIFFKNKDPISNEIINTFYTIKFHLEKLELVKKYILSILLTSKCKFESIKINKNKYKLLKKFLIINFHGTYKETFKKKGFLNKAKKLMNEDKESVSFDEFLQKFINNNYNILQSYHNTLPYYYTIFENTYDDESNKDFFLKLFRKYNDVRIKLLNYLLYDPTNKLANSYNGLYSFNFMFDILTHKENNDNNSIKCNNKNSNNYIINNVATANNNENNNTKKTKPTLDKKINLYDSLYYNNISSDFYKNNHLNNMNNLYNNLLTSIDNAFNSQSSSLYKLIINSLNLDFNLIKFIFCYVEPKLFNKAIDSYYQINDYIYGNINNFQAYYDDYINWYNKLISGISSTSGAIGNSIDDSNFEEYFDKIFSRL